MLPKSYTASARDEWLTHLRTRPRQHWAERAPWGYAPPHQKTPRLFGSPMFDSMRDDSAAVREYRKVVDEMGAWRVQFPPE